MNMEQRLRPVKEAASKLHTALEDKDSPLIKFEPLIQGYRIACQTLILEDFELATSKDIEGKLWEGHVRVNGRFRKQLGYFSGLKGKEKKPVEQRKTAKIYLDFVKSSQKFYRGFVQRLASKSGGIAELEAVAHRFSSDATAAALGEKLKITAELRHAVLQSCHKTLVHLGDLSRYRESEMSVKGKNKNWGPAIGYYDLAIAVDPSSGIPYNQLAIISKTEGDHARALYHLYRAQCAFEPPATAFANLELEFKKIREASERGCEEAETCGPSDDPLATLQRVLPLLHARYFGSMEFPEYMESETKMLESLIVGLTKHMLETSFVNRMVLSNIAADFTAGDRWQDAPELTQNELAFGRFQALNVRTFCRLLKLLLTEYQNHTKPDSPDGIAITPVTRRLLPGLRLYSVWLTSRAALLSVHLGDSTFGKSIEAFWMTYVEILSSVTTTVSFNHLPRLDYLLEEDEEIIDFRPLQEEQRQPRYSNPDATIRKPKCHEHGVKRHHPNIEMLCRIRDFVEDAIDLAQNDFVPVKFDQDTGCFIVQEGWARLGPSQASLEVGSHLESTSPKQLHTSRPEDTSLPDAESTTDDAFSQGISVPISLSTAMNQMVDNLVGPGRGTSAASPPSSPPVPTLPSCQGDGPHETSYGVGNSMLTALDFVNQVRSWSPETKPKETPKPSLPSILNSPFAPRPEEEPTLTGLSTSHKRQQSQQSQPMNITQLQQLPSHSVASTASTMSETQFSYVTNGHLLHPSLKSKVFGKRQHHATFADDFNFDSSNIVTGSSFPYNARDHESQPTPPNGQG